MQMKEEGMNTKILQSYQKNTVNSAY